MRFRKASVPLPTAPPEPFPVRVLLIAIDSDGEEVLRYDLDCAMTAYGQTLHLDADLTLTEN